MCVFNIEKNEKYDIMAKNDNMRRYGLNSC